MKIRTYNPPSRSGLSAGQIEDLLDRAEDRIPDSDFVQSVREWYEEKGFITSGQEQGLRNTADAERPISEDF